MRQALGKGLEALLGGAQIPQDGSSNNGVQSIPVNKIIPNRYQPRKTFNEESLKELAQSIKQHGLTQPVVVVYDSGLDKYELVVGERRWRATQLAGLKDVQAIVHSKLDEKQLCALALIENIQRENLNPIETALGYRSLIQKFEVSQSELGEYCGKSKAAVSNTLRLLELPSGIQEAISSGKITEGHGRALLMLSDEKKQDILLKKIIAGKMSVRQAESAARALLLPSKETKKTAKTPDIQSFEQSLQEALGAKVELRQSSKHGRGILMLHYNSLEELDRLAERLKSKML
ncbi:MAG: ParB/RepB/Spo0J family partition protein [Elusimicrobiota bacterium]|jgi:ParB family chromosome partitioning protein|nr:ParB/RepB/Spo0J family partition protein [Elusimicrobiota bacterium]